MAQLKAIKGPASNKDMDWAISTVNDPASPKENKVRAVQILRAQMDAHLKSSEQTLKGMGTTGVKVDIPAAGGATAAPAAPAAAAVTLMRTAKAWLDANPNDPRADAVRKKLEGNNGRSTSPLGSTPDAPPAAPAAASGGGSARWFALMNAGGAVVAREGVARPVSERPDGSQ